MTDEPSQINFFYLELKKKWDLQDKTAPGIERSHLLLMH